MRDKLIDGSEWGFMEEQSRGGRIMGPSRYRSEAAQRDILEPCVEVKQARWGTQEWQRLRKTQSSCKAPSNPTSHHPPFT